MAHVGVNYADHRRGCGLEALDDCRAETELARAVQHDNAVPAREIVRQRPRAIG